MICPCCSFTQGLLTVAFNKAGESNCTDFNTHSLKSSHVRNWKLNLVAFWTPVHASGVLHEIFSPLTSARPKTKKKTLNRTSTDRISHRGHLRTPGIFRALGQRKRKSSDLKVCTVSGRHKVQHKQISNGARSQTAVKTTAGDYGRERSAERQREGAPLPMTLMRL